MCDKQGRVLSGLLFMVRYMLCKVTLLCTVREDHLFVLVVVVGGGGVLSHILSEKKSH